VTGIASIRRSSVFPPVIGSQCPSGVVCRRRNCFHLQWCRSISMRATRRQVKESSMLKVFFATACLKYLAQPCMIRPSLASTYPRSCCDVLRVRARILAFSDRMGRPSMKV
jgi:hypothetical protein